MFETDIVKLMVSKFDGDLTDPIPSEWLRHANPVIKDICPNGSEHMLVCLHMLRLPEKLNNKFRSRNFGKPFTLDSLEKLLVDAYPVQGWGEEYSRLIKEGGLVSLTDPVEVVEESCMRAWALMKSTTITGALIMDYLAYSYGHQSEKAFTRIPFVDSREQDLFIDSLDKFLNQLADVQEYLKKIRTSC